VKRNMIAAILVATVGLTIGACDAPTQRRGLPACVTEDSVNCHWDAKKQGNGMGRSFTAGPDGTITYTTPEEWVPFRNVRGHHGCEILIGETSKIRCADGYTDES
jgi:hypothetical protein